MHSYCEGQREEVRCGQAVEAGVQGRGYQHERQRAPSPGGGGLHVVDAAGTMWCRALDSDPQAAVRTE